VHPALSVTVALKPEVLAVLGVPLTVPVREFSARFDGGVPLHLLGCDPPEAIRFWLYRTPTSPGGKVIVVRLGQALMVMDRSCVAVAPLFVSVA